HGAPKVRAHPVQGDDAVFRQAGQIEPAFPHPRDASYREVINGAYIHGRAKAFHLPRPKHGQAADGRLDREQARRCPHYVAEETAASFRFGSSFVFSSSRVVGHSPSTSPNRTHGTSRAGTRR